MATKSSIATTTCLNTPAGHVRTSCATRLLPLLLLVTLSAAVQAQDYAYEIHNDTVAITGYIGSGGAVDIPGMIEDLPVTSIGSNAFTGGSGLTRVTIPDSVTSIGDEAFSDCSGLARADFLGNAPGMGNAVFNGCADGFTVYYRATATGFTTPAWYDYPSMIRDDTPDAFVFPDISAAELGAVVESAAITVTGINTPAAISREGGEYAVSADGGGSWTDFSASVPVTVNNGDRVKLRVIASANFATTVDMTLNIGGVSDTWIVRTQTPWVFEYTDNDASIAITGYIGFGGAVTIPGMIENLPVTSIGSNAFTTGGSGLTSVTIPENVTGIGAGAFQNCANLARADFLGNAPVMGGAVFDGCADGFAVYYLANSTGFTAPTWYGYPSVIRSGTPDAFVFPDVTEAELGSVALSAAITVTGINIPAAITVQGGEYAVSTDGGTSWNAFSVSVPAIVNNGDRVKLRVTASANFATTVDVTLDIGGISDTWTVTTRAPPVFEYTSNGTSITITGYLGSGGAVDIPGTIEGLPVTGIGDQAFYHCSSLTSVTIPDSVTSIGGWAFVYCTSLSRVTIPDSVTSIGYAAFYFCGSLTSVTIPDSVTSLGDYAFYSCARLARAEFLGNAPTMGYADSVFYGCAEGFAVYYLPSATGFTSPTWYGFPCISQDYSGGWRFPLAVTQADLTVLELGLVTGASDLFDNQWDWLLLSEPLDHVARVRFVELDHDYQKDYHGTAPTSTWILAVDTRAQPVEITWDSAAIPASNSLTVAELDQAGKLKLETLLDMGRTEILSVPANSTKTYEITYGLAFDLTLRSGWNLISLPIEPHDPAVENLFYSSARGQVNLGSVWTWNGRQFMAAGELHALQGGWVYLAEPIVIRIYGAPPPESTVSTTVGWNLAGPVASVPAPSSPAVALPAWGWNGHSYEMATTLNPGNGYWIYAIARTVINMK